MVAPNRMIAANSATVVSANASADERHRLDGGEPDGEPGHRQPGHDATADEAGDDRHAGDEDRRQRRGALAGTVLDELDELLDPADLGAEDEDVGDRAGDEEAGAHGLGERCARGDERRHVLAHPLAVGHPAERRWLWPDEPQGERHDAEHPDDAEDRRRRRQAVLVDQPLGDAA